MSRPLLRAQLESAIERAITVLDQMDGDFDLEANCDDDDDRSDHEAPLCGVNFGKGDWQGYWAEAVRSAPFEMDQAAS